MIHYENMTKEQIIGILKGVEEYIGEVHKDYDIQKKEIERLNNIIKEEQDKISNAIDYIKSNKLVDVDIVLDKLYGGDKE